MATSSITANFYTDDPKAANAIVHALFTQTEPSRDLPLGSPVHVHRTVAQRQAFFKKAHERATACAHA